MLKEMFSFQGRYKILHYTWFAFFLTFVVWFNLPPLATTLREDFGLDAGQMGTLALCNVALTVPARIIIGMLLDKFGPRLTYSVLLVYAVIPCFIFATAQDFSQLVIGRLLMGIVGAGFVIGIRMTAEWFPPKEIGLAEGVYGGWGNFGSAFSALTLVIVAGILSLFPGAYELATGEVLNWRLAILATGTIAAIYGVIYYNSVQDTPPGKVYQRPQRHGGMEVTSKWDFWFLLFMNLPLSGILGVLAWRLQKVNFLTETQMYIAWAALAGLYLFQSFNCFQANKELMTGRRVYSSEDRYSFSQVAMLELTYIVNFGSELAVVSILPAFFEGTFGLSKALAGALGASFAFVNLVARPAGGLISDRLGSRKNTMTVLTLGMGIGYLVMSSIPSLRDSLGLPGGIMVILAVLMTMTCSLFVQSGEGSTFALVPLVKRRITGQVAGNVGAYGNVGAVSYLTIRSLLPGWIADGGEITPAVIDQSNVIFFQILGVTGLIVGITCAIFLQEPKGSFAESHEGEDPHATITANAIEMT